MALDRSGLLEPADSSSEDDEEEEVLGLGLKDSEDEEDLITQKEQLEDEELEEDEERGIVPFGEKEQKLLQRFEKYLHSDDEEVHPDEEMGNIVSDKAWGKKKSIFYHTDYVDDEMGGSEEEEMAEEEEKEGLALQQRMAEEVDEEAYLAPEKSVLSGDQGFHKKKSKELLEENVVITDLSTLSKEEKLQILAKESPEIFQLLEDYKAKLQDAKKLHPLVLAMRQKENSSLFTTESCKVAELLLQSYLVYAMNIAFYLKLKSERVPVRNHPVIASIAALRDNLQRMKPAESKLFSQLEEVMRMVRKKGEMEGGVNERATVLGENTSTGVVSSLLKKTNVRKGKAAADERQIPDDDIVDVDGILSGFDPELYYSKVKHEVEMRKRKKESKKQTSNQEWEEDDEEVDSQAKRAITYEIARNKGLTPKRKKEQRNPRVKHKLKYEKAKRRRKGQVLPVAVDKGVYGGEKSGIRSTVSRSVKIK
jgi:U3 small nucleolar RNA-associated protein 3